MVKDPRRPTTSSEDEPRYEVGYRRPPRHSRFKPGQCGNPKGRPKGSRNVRKVVESTLNQRITVREAGRERRISKLDAFVLSVANKAMQGDAKTQSVLIQLMRSVGMIQDVPEPTSTEPVTAHDADIIADFLRRHGASTENVTAPENAVGDRQSSPPGKETKR